MKNTKFKLITAILAFSLLLGAAFAIAASADTAAGPQIISNNMEYSEKYSLMYAVDASTVTEGPVTLNLYTADPAGEGVQIKRSYTAAEPETIKINGGDVSAYVFITDGVEAKSLTQLFWAQAVDATGAAGNVTRYSVIEYMYERLSGQQEITENQETLYRAVIELASASTQVLINDKIDGTENDYTLAKDYSYVYFPSGDGFIGETEDAAAGYEAGIYPIGTTIYPTVAATSTGNITVTVYDDNAAVKLQKVLKNGAAYQLDGDMTIITAGGEMPYSPDLTDTDGRLTFDNGETATNNTWTFNSGKTIFKHNSTAGLYNVVTQYPWSVESNVLQILLNGTSQTWWADIENETAGSDAKGIKYEFDLMFTAPSTATTWSFNIVTAHQAATNTARAQIIVNTNGTLQLKDRETNELTTLSVTTGQWFRLTVEYLNNDTDGIKANWYVNGKLIDSTERLGDTTAITAIHALWIQTNGTITGNAYLDNIKAEIIK